LSGHVGYNFGDDSGVFLGSGECECFIFWGQKMTKIVKQSFQNKTEVLDGREFVDCEFVNCTVVYRGGTLPMWTNCRFDECRFQFEDSADRTLNFLKMMYHSCPGAGPQFVDSIFKQMGQLVPSGGNK
jgi:hypothetical protein